MQWSDLSMKRSGGGARRRGCLALALCGAWGLAAATVASGNSLETIPSSGVYEVSGNTPVPIDKAYQAVGNQITTRFWDNGNGTITFDFQNVGPIHSIVTGIYFQDGSWLAAPPSGIADNSGVVWELGGNPNSLPGGNTAGFLSDCALDTQDNQKGIGSAAGINNGAPPGNDELQLTFHYVNGIKFSDVLAGMDGTFKNSSGYLVPPLELGFFVQSINYNGQTAASASFVGSGETPPNNNYSGSPVPVPASVTGGLVLLCGIGLFKLWRSRSVPSM